MLSARDVYATASGFSLSGPDRCHYCGGACERTTTHNEPVPVLLGRTDTYGVTRKKAEWAAYPGLPYVCLACQAWRRPRITVPYFGGGIKDGQTARKHAWYCTPGGAWGVGPSSGPKLMERLLSPAARFFLALLEGDEPPDNLLQCFAVNDNDEIKAETPLHFTVNNVPHTYTVYQLEQAGLRRTTQGLDPGAAALVRILGPVPEHLIAGLRRTEEEREAAENGPKERGRPAVLPEDPRYEQARRTLRPGKKAA
jgi:hypothetical protein